MALDQLFTFWTTTNGHTFIKSIKELMPGNYAIITKKSVEFKEYYQWKFPSLTQKIDANYADQKILLESYLSDAVKIRLRGDEEVASYLSGGLDSSIIVSLASKSSELKLKTYSLSFQDNTYDERKFQKIVAAKFKTIHNECNIDKQDISTKLLDVIWHTESPIFRTAPIALYNLSSKVSKDGIKVVLSGEGSDEIFLGYDIFKEVKLREKWKKNLNSKTIPVQFKKLYSYLPHFSNPRYASMAVESFRLSLDSKSLFFSHIPRWNNNAFNKVYFSSETKNILFNYDCIAEFENSIPPEFLSANAIDRAQYLELQTLLRGYLLSSQGDRMLMKHSVEGRFPFLDNNVVDLASRLPESSKLLAMNDKRILRGIANLTLPPEIVKRQKFAFQAPEIRAFCQVDGKLDEISSHYLSAEFIEDKRIFANDSVQILLNKIKNSELDRLGTRDNMAFIQILSTHIFIEKFIKNNIRDQAKKDKINNTFKYISFN